MRRPRLECAAAKISAVDRLQPGVQPYSVEDPDVEFQGLRSSRRLKRIRVLATAPRLVEDFDIGPKVVVLSISMASLS